MKQIVRCKMKCDSVLETPHAREYSFSAVCADEIPENLRYHKYTPSGSLKLSVTNPDVKYQVGASYYFDSSPVPVENTNG